MISSLIKMYRRWRHERRLKKLWRDPDIQKYRVKEAGESAKAVELKWREAMERFASGDQWTKEEIEGRPLRNPPLSGKYGETA